MKTITHAQYMAFKKRAGAISQSDVKAVLANLEMWKRGDERAQSEAMVFGSAYDCLLLTPEQFGVEFPVLPYEKANAAGAKAWLAEHAGKTILRSHPVRKEVTASEVESAVASTLQNPKLKHITSLIPDSETQLSHAAKVGGRILCAKYDFIPPADSEFGDWLIDVKTTSELDREYSRTILKFGYHIQGAWYLDLFKA